MLQVKRIANSLFVFGLLLFLVGCVTASSGPANIGARPVQPDWVRDPYLKYNRNIYLAAVGSGSTQQIAQNDALGKLVSIFGQNIQVDQTVSILYQEAARSGVTASWSEATAIDSAIITSAGMENLIGAELGDFWEDGRGSSFAVAILHKERAASVYHGLLKANQEIIDNLLDIQAAQRNSLDAFARYQFAAVVADVTASYSSVLSVIGAPMPAARRGDDIRRGAQEIVKNIPVLVRVNGDNSGSRIRDAFAGALSNMGFNSGGTGPRYVLDVNVVTEPVNLSGNENIFSRINLSANLFDNVANTILLPYNFSLREGHRTQGEADNRAYLAAERKIKDEYPDLLQGYFSRLVPRR
jgi:hypothetical protein